MTSPASAESIGEQLIRTGRLTSIQVLQIVELQRREKLRFGEAAMRLGLLTELDLQSALAGQYNYANTISGDNSMFSHLAIASEPFGREAEAVRQIRAGISNQLSSPAPQTLAIVSPGQNEGKSYMASSLAVAFAQAGKRTLLINGNLRESGQHGLLSNPAPGHPGLSSILAGRAAPQPGVAVPYFPKLNLLDAGPPPPNPAELLLEPALKSLIQSFSTKFDLFIIDTAAYTLYSDAQIIVRQADAYIALARRDQTELGALREMSRQLEQLSVLSLGTIYNEAPATKASSLLKRNLRARRS